MAVRVKIRVRSARGKAVDTVAILNGGFEASVPYLLLPAQCAQELFGNYRKSALRQEMQAAGARVFFLAIPDKVRVRVVSGSLEGMESEFGVLVSESDSEVLVSDTGIDALGVRIESFAPGRWRLSGDSPLHESEPPQHWPVGGRQAGRRRKRP